MDSEREGDRDHMKELTLSPQGENSPFRKTVTLQKFLFCEIYFNTV